MANIDITEEEAIVIAESVKTAASMGNLEDEYTAFYLMQTFKREFPNLTYLFDFLDYEFSKDFDDEDE